MARHVCVPTPDIEAGLPYVSLHGEKFGTTIPILIAPRHVVPVVSTYETKCFSYRIHLLTRLTAT